MHQSPRLRMYCRQSAIQSTCCSQAKIIWLLTPGLCGPGILDGSADFSAHELRCRFVGFFVEQQICKRIQKTDAAAFRPFRLVGAQPLVLGCLEGRLYGCGVAGDSERRIERGAAALGILVLVGALLRRVERHIARRQAEMGGPLKDVKMLCLLCDDRYRLDT